MKQCRFKPHGQAGTETGGGRFQNPSLDHPVFVVPWVEPGFLLA